jgi:peptidoglycan/xylan/chitin deacetylase (PgdA/CDA1 family)
MIGVVANPSDSAVVQEFFELFKTPWEFYRSGQAYDVLLCCGHCDLKAPDTRLVLVYERENGSPAADHESSLTAGAANRVLSYKGGRLPLYCGGRTYADGNAELLVDATSNEPALKQSQSGGAVVVEIGYDLFREVEHLLTSGQPVTHAASPTLDLHIALLRDLICSHDIALAEIPPTPFGYPFIACLTHDIDHPRLRAHKFDHTMFGFLYRATVGSAIDFAHKRTSAENLMRNWLAALRLPFVHLGFAPDFWSEFDRYTEIEGDCPSSFFVIPFKRRPGRTRDGVAAKRRGAAYGASEIAGQLRKLMAAGCEIGLHGIDAWMDSAAGREELNEVRSITGEDEIGVRMHWLFFDAESPAALEQAGASYDSTVGYNETIGYRAGTAQAYKPLNAEKLLELPLLAMDTALFYPGYLHLSAEDAAARVNALIETAVEHGGCMTVNWHDRSIAPERLWTGAYVRLIQDLKSENAWFATAAQATAWFRMRRAARFEVNADRNVVATLPTRRSETLPGLTLRTYRSASGESEDTALVPNSAVLPSHATACR